MKYGYAELSTLHINVYVVGYYNFAYQAVLPSRGKLPRQQRAWKADLAIRQVLTTCCPTPAKQNSPCNCYVFACLVWDFHTVVSYQCRNPVFGGSSWQLHSVNQGCGSGGAGIPHSTTLETCSTHYTSQCRKAGLQQLALFPRPRAPTPVL